MTRLSDIQPAAVAAFFGCTEQQLDELIGPEHAPARGDKLGFLASNKHVIPDPRALHVARAFVDAALRHEQANANRADVYNTIYRACQAVDQAIMCQMDQWQRAAQLAQLKENDWIDLVCVIGSDTRRVRAQVVEVKMPDSGNYLKVTNVLGSASNSPLVTLDAIQGINGTGQLLPSWDIHLRGGLVQIAKERFDFRFQ